MMIFELSIVAIAFTTVVVCLILYARRNYGILEELGIPVVKPTFCLGSDPYGYRKVQHLEDIKRMKQYGPVYGYYEGGLPTIHISDPRLVRLIMVKDYEYFRNRNVADFAHSVANEMLDWLQDNKWKTTRTMLSSCFTTNRIKSMVPIFDSICKEHVSDLKEKAETDKKMVLDFKPWMTMLIVDMVGKCYCGIEFESRKDPKNDLCELFRNILGHDNKHNFLTFTLPNVFPFLRPFFPPMPKDLVDRFANFSKSLIHSRKANEDDRSDFLGTMTNYWNRVDSEEFKKLGITEATIQAQIIEFFLVSYDSAGTPIVHLIYYLAKHPEVQEKLSAEVKDTYQKYDGAFGYDAINNMNYLTACMSETYRLVPAFYRAERKCTKTWVDEESGLRIPKDMTVLFDLWAINRDPKSHENPEHFIPERFLPDRKKDMNPYAYSTFGHGPKNCAGMSWSYAMAKILIANLIHEFEILERPDTEMKYKAGNLYIPQYGPVLVDIVPRKHN